MFFKKVCYSLESFITSSDEKTKFGNATEKCSCTPECYVVSQIDIHFCTIFTYTYGYWSWKAKKIVNSNTPSTPRRLAPPFHLSAFPNIIFLIFMPRQHQQLLSKCGLCTGGAHITQPDQPHRWHLGGRSLTPHSACYSNTAILHSQLCSRSALYCLSPASSPFSFTNLLFYFFLYTSNINSIRMRVFTIPRIWDLARKETSRTFI